MIAGLLIGFALGSIAYPAGSWLVAFWRTRRPIAFGYRSHCSGCEVKSK